jgi:type II secretory pathway pseudopilin PulG
MIGLLCFVLAVLASPFKSKVRLQAENAVLRHQLNVVRRRLRGRVRLTNHDRWFLIQLYRWFPSILKVLTRNGRPETGKHYDVYHAVDLFFGLRGESP